ncbi:MAG: hypothetical protein ACO1OK_08870, partial [Devosia sp.]
MKVSLGLLPSGPDPVLVGSEGNDYQEGDAPMERRKQRTYRPGASSIGGKESGTMGRPIASAMTELMSIVTAAKTSA